MWDIYGVIITNMTDYEHGEWDMFVLISSAFWGKQYYFLQNDGKVYSRKSNKYMGVDDAYVEFANTIGDDGSI